MSIERALQLQRTNYGRSEGWIMRVNGEEVATLLDPVWEDMFWFSYQLWPTDKEADTLLRTEEVWLRKDITYQSIAMGEITTFAYAGGSEFYNGGRVVMRCLSLSPKGRFEETVIELASLWTR